MMLLCNDSSIPFITGDTPIVNISDQEDSIFFYYPISPKIAVSIININEPKENIVIELDESLKEIVNCLNKKLFDNCVNEIY